MKSFKDLQIGDTIYVKCPWDTNYWTPEIITKIEDGEDGYKGSGMFYRRIYTDYSVNVCPDERCCNEHVHWPIFSACTSKKDNYYEFEANSSTIAHVKF